MNRFLYFKITFLSISAGLFAGMMVYGLFDLDFSKSDAVIQLVLKSSATALGTGLILGLLNSYFQIGKFHNRKRN